MTKFIFKSFLFLSPLLMALCIELFILPIDYFTFRVWEALVVKLVYILPGPFYPKMEIRKIEEGELAHHTPDAIKKEVKWVTDRFGYRKQDRNHSRYKMVIIGDSNMVGSGSTQKDMLSEVLEDRLKAGVYTFAPTNKIDYFLKDRRFRTAPPDIVIFSSVERFISDLQPLPSDHYHLLDVSPLLKQWAIDLVLLLRNDIVRYTSLQSMLVLIDRLYKNNMLHYARASIRRIGIFRYKNIYSNFIHLKHGPVFFFTGPAANQDVEKSKLDQAIHTIKIYHDIMKSKGIRFIFLPIPEKENIYYEYLHTKRPVFLEKLISGLKDLGVETIDTQTAFENAFRQGVLLYHPDDTHWNENAIRITADLIEKTLRKGMVQ